MTRAGSLASSSEADGIRYALHQQLSDPDQDLMPLREAVCAFVATLRDRGLPPERTLVAVKDVMGSVHASPQHLERLREITSLITKWCVEEYYGSSPAD
jgi:hypothetical protein